jgi:hypothetical protein
VRSARVTVELGIPWSRSGIAGVGWVVGGEGRDGNERRVAYLSGCVLHGTERASLSTATEE